MTEKIKYTCSCCGKEHEEWPALTFISPDDYNVLSAAEKENLAELTNDFCTIDHGDHIGRFIRCTMTQKVVDHCKNLNYGIWVSLSEKSFKDYSDNYYRTDYETQYFGWMSNDIREYVFDESIPTTVFTRTGNKRPEIVPHEDFDHPFVKDYYEGITKAEAEKRIQTMLKNTR